MKLTLIGHEDRYAVEQLQMSLFGPDAQGEAFSSIHRGKTYLTAVTKIIKDGKTAMAQRRLKVSEESVRLRRRILLHTDIEGACYLIVTRHREPMQEQLHQHNSSSRHQTQPIHTCTYCHTNGGSSPHAGSCRKTLDRGVMLENHSGAEKADTADHLRR